MTLDLWNSVEKTDPKYTKSFNRGGFNGTSINGTYIIKRLTETFGPNGMGWKFVIEDERIESGHTIYSDIGNNVYKIHIVRGHIEYMLNGIWYSTSPQFGQTTFVGANKNGFFTDEEAPKKSITDCIGKCAVLIGLCADVHLGMFDDNKYINNISSEPAAPKQVNTISADAQTKNAVREIISKAKMAKTSDEVKILIESDAMEEIKSTSEKSHQYAEAELIKIISKLEDLGR